MNVKQASKAPALCDQICGLPGDRNALEKLSKMLERECEQARFRADQAMERVRRRQERKRSRKKAPQRADYPSDDAHAEALGRYWQEGL